MKRNNYYFIKTFGCQMNVADSERIAGWYENRGWKPADKIEKADEAVINSCSVRQSAENRVFGLVNNLFKLKIKNSKFKIILTGCMLRYPLADLRKKLPGVNEFKKISEFLLDSKFIIHNSSVHAYIPIMEGCNNFCSYCVVPYARGREKSKPLKEILCEAKELVERGYREITLLGQNVNSYGKDSQISKSKSKTKNFKVPFAELLKELSKIEKLEKISFMTSNPWDLTDDIIETMSLPKIDRYLHLAVQSGNNEILKKMNRKYSAKDFLALVKKIRQKIPEIKIGTDIIVGFPGESEKQFQDTVALCRKIGFTKAYISLYSPRPGTGAFKLKDDIPYREKKRRWLILDRLINRQAA